MKEVICSLLAVLGLAACQGDETLAGYVMPDTTFVLQRMGGEAVKARATIRFLPGGEVVGKAACNSYGAAQSAPYPWFELGPIRATRAACPQLDEEQAYFDALGQMTLAEISGDVLILSNEDGEMLEFRAMP